MVVARDLQNDIKIRGLRILLDGEQVADLSYGRTYETSLAPGTHKLKVTNTLSSKEETIEVKPGDTLHFRAGNKMPGFWSWMLMMVCVAPYRVMLQRVQTETSLRPSAKLTASSNEN